MKDVERRYVPDATMEMRGLPGAGAVLFGHGAVFNEETIIGNSFREVVRPGAFRKTIQESDIRVLVNHDPNIVLGRNKAGTAVLAEDSVGLAYEVTLPDTQQARDFSVSIARGDITGCSFSFAPVGKHGESWQSRGDGMPLRELLELRCWDVGPVTFPYYEGTDVDLQRALRSLAEEMSRPLDELIAAARNGWPETTEPEPGGATTQPEPRRRDKARREFELMLLELGITD